MCDNSVLNFKFSSSTFKGFTKFKGFTAALRSGIPDSTTCGCPVNEHTRWAYNLWVWEWVQNLSDVSFSNGAGGELPPIWYGLRNSTAHGLEDPVRAQVVPTFRSVCSF